MDKKQRKKELEKLAKSPQGQALKEFFEEKILEMRDLSTIDTWDETLGRKVAINKINGIMRTLNLLKEDIPKITKENYT